MLGSPAVEAVTDAAFATRAFAVGRLPPIRFDRARRGAFAYGIRFLVLAIAYLLESSYPALAADVTVVVTNKGANTIYVAFTNYTTQAPGQINWGNCASSVSNSQVAIATGATCTASVPATAGLSRFCAATTAMTTPNCNTAQANHQTMVETNFSAGPACYPTTMASCVWYDISVIPQNCTDSGWTQNQCAGTGGASYNLPVSLACASQPTFTCQGPGNALGSNYPANCGNPNASCVGNASNCVNAYFYPMASSSYGPNSQCPAGSSLAITFLAGQ